MSSRPESYDDLADHQRADEQVGRLDKELLDREDIDLAAALFTFLKALRNAGYLVDTEGGYTITRPKTDDELDSALHWMQRKWDEGKRFYEAGLLDNFRELLESDYSYRRYYVDDYVKAEGLDPVDWDAFQEAL